MANDTRRKLFNALNQAGFDIGSYDDFDRRMNNQADRKKFYDAVSNAGYDIGDYDAFNKRITPSKYSLKIKGVNTPVSEKEYKDYVGRHGVGASAQPTRTEQKGSAVVQQQTRPVAAAKQQPTQPAGRPMTAQERSRMMASAGAIVNGSQDIVSQFDQRQKNREEYRRQQPLGQRVAKTKRLNQETGKLEDTYLTSQGSETNSQYAGEKEQRAINEAYREPSVDEQLQEALAMRDKLNKEMGENDVEWVDQEGRVHYKGAGGDEHMRSLEAAYRQNEERIRTLTYEKNDAGFWEHTGRELGDMASWNPYNAASDATALLRTKQKIDSGKKLDAEDNLLLANTLLNQEAHAQYDKNRDAWFRAGGIAAESIRLLPDFAIGMGPMKGIATGVARGTGKVVTKAIGKEVANKVAGKILTKAAGVAAGSLAAGAVMANTVQAPRLASETMKNMTGDLTLDKDGHFQFEGGENFLNSVLKAEQTLIPEAASEVTGEFLPGVGTVLEKVGLKKIAGGLARLQGTKWYRGYSKALEKVGFHGAPGEMLEEYAGDVYSAVLGDLSGIVGDPNSRKTDNVLFGHGGGWGDLDKHIDIALGTVTLGALLHAPSYIITGYQGAKYLRYRHQTNMADKAGRNMMGSTAWDGIKASLDNSTNESISDALSQVYRDWNLTNDGRKAALDYAMSLQRQRGHILAVMADNKEEKDEPGRAADVISNSYASGYEADSKEEKEAITQNVQLSDDNLSRFGEGFANWVKDESNPPMATLSYMMSHRDVYSDEQIAAAADYYQTKAAADGMTQAAADRAELEGNQEPSPSYTTLDNMGGQFTVSTFDKEGSLLGQRVFSTEEEANAYRGEVRMQKEHAELQDYYGRALVEPQLTEQVAAFEEEQGWEAGTVQRLAESDPMKLSETELQMADIARSFLQGIAYPANEVHTEQSKQSGVDAAENSDIDTDHPNAEVVSSIVAPYIEARDRLNQLFAQNETLAEEVQTYEQMGRSEQEVIASLDSFRPEDVQTVIDFYNAQARFEGFMNRTQEKIEERVKNERGRRTFKGNINNRQDTVDLIELTDGENRYTLVNGDIQTDAEGRVISADGIIIALDENGDFVKLGANSSLQILPQETTLDMWEQAYREQVQTNASAVIDADGTLNPAGVIGGDEIAGEETGREAASAEPPLTEPAATGTQPTEAVAATGSQQTEPVDEGGEEAPVSAPATVESVADKDGVKRYEKGIDVDAAIDDIQADGFDVNEVADASIDEAQETIDKINAKERKTRKDLMERKAAQDTIDYYQRLKERHAERQNGGGEAAVVQEQTEPVDGGGMPPSGEVPEWRYDTPEGARGRGYKVIEGHRVDRQAEKPMPAGKEVEVQYSTKDKVKGRLTVSELGEVQGSHLTNGQRNERHFLPEAQPKDEFGADRQTAAQTNASEANFRPELMLTFNDTQSAYSGSASQTNRRGEVIQGNGRRNLAEYIYAPGNEAVAERYKQYLMAHAEELGTTAEEIAKMEKPFAHIVLDVTDEEAIRLGQFTAQDLESGGKKVPEVSSTVTKLGNRYGSFANIVLNHEDPDASLAERIDANAEAAIKWLNQGGFINNTEAKTLLEDKALGRQFLKDMITDTLFKGASPNLRTMFFELPKNIQSAIVSVIGREVGLDPDMSILKNIQESILAYHELMNSSEQFAKAQGSNFEKRYAAATAAVNDWLRQINMDGTVNSEKFSNFALELAKRYRSLKDQKSLAGNLRSYYDKATGATRELGMFDDNSQEPTNKKELIKQIFGIDYDARQRAVPLAGDHRGSEEGREGSSDRTEGDERKPEGTGAADDRGGDTGDAGGVIPQSREEYLSSHPLTEEQIMADTEATEDEKLNAIDFLKGEDDSAISRFYYDGIYNRAQENTEKNSVDKPFASLAEVKKFMDEIGYKGSLSRVMTDNNGKKFVKYQANGNVTPNIVFGETTRRDVYQQFHNYRNVMDVDIPSNVEAEFERADASLKETRDALYASDRDEIKQILTEAGIPFADVVDSERGSRIVFTDKKNENGNYTDWMDVSDPEQAREDIALIKAKAERYKADAEDTEKPSNGQGKSEKTFDLDEIESLASAPRSVRSVIKDYAISAYNSAYLKVPSFQFGVPTENQENMTYEKFVSAFKEQAGALAKGCDAYLPDVYEYISKKLDKNGLSEGEERDSWQSATDEEFYPVAKEWLDQQEKPYSSALQRKFKIGYKKATRIMERYMSEKEAGEPPSVAWRYELHYDKETGKAWITRDDVSGTIPIGDASFRIEGKSLAELRGILENPKNNLGEVLQEVEAQLHNAEAGEQIRKANTPTEAIEQAASSFREGQKKEEKAPEKEREEQKSKDQQDIDDALKEFEDFLDGAKGSSVLDKFMRKGLEGNDKAQASLLDAFTLTNEAQRMFLKDLLRLASKVGYAYIKSGVHDAQAWSKKMADGVGRKLREVLGWDDAVVGEFVDEVWQQKYTVDGVRMRLSEHAERLKNGKGADTAVNVNKTENNEAEKELSLQQEASEKPKTKDGWLKKMNEVFSKLCEKYGVPDDPIIFNQWGGRYNFDYRITKGYRLDQFEPYYEAYKKKLDADVEPATEKQLALIDRLAEPAEKEMLHSIKLNKVSASYVISILKAAEDAISNRMSTLEMFEEYANELEKVAKLHGWKPAPKLEGDSVEFAERQEKIDTLRADIRRELKGLVMNGGKPHPMSFYKELSEKAGVGNLSATDLQELIEAEVVAYARELASEKDKTDKQKYDQIVMLYQMQPSLNARDNDRINKQQYSTPAPMAFLMGKFLKEGKEVKSGLEPSAGNGMLTLNLPKDGMHVNDIDEMRLSNLAKQGFGEVTSQDGTQPFEQKAYDVVVTNPPFGSVPPKTYDGLYEISGLEHQMAINALESMKDDGRAAIIIGGNTEYNQNGTIKGKDRAFLNYLYAHYNVVDVINMDGKTLYSRQGTGFPVRMILINGRREFNPKNFAPVESKARAERVNSYDELFKRVSDDILSDNNKSAGVHNAESGESNGKHDNGHAGTATEAGVRTVRSGRGSEQHQLLDTSGQHVSGSTERTDGGTDTRTDTSVVGRSDVVHGAGSTTSQPSGDTATPAEQGGNVPNRRDNAERPDGRVDVAVGAGQRGSGASQQGDGAAIESQQEKTGQERASAQPQPTGREAATRTLHTERDEKEQKVEVKRGLGTEKVPYRKQSGNPFTLQSLMPAEQADVVKKALEDLGDVDQFLVDELGYSSKEELHQALAAEQIDSVAMAIHQMNQGNAFIIGDQTGIGKGRQAAALIRYGVKKGGFPVFITVKKGLFSDMYRDLCDIGSPGLRPFIWSADDSEHSADVTDKDGNVVYKRPSDKEQKRVVDYINKYGKLPPEYDYIITTYDSFKGGTMVYEEGQKKARSFGKKQPTTGAHNSQAKRDALERLAENSYVIMDESHNAGGETSAVSGYLQYITTRAKGVTFLSATFAKRPGNMPIYSLKTAIAKAGVKVGELIDAVKRGGATFQEIMSKALTEAGQMIRRERDMSGVTIDWKGIEDEAVIEKQREQYDTIIGLFNDIIDFQRRYVDPIVNRRNDEAAEIQGEVDHTPGTRDMGINNTPFASRTYNMVQQVLLSLKAEETAKRAIEHIKMGHKPVIALANTNEGAADDVSTGEDMEMPDLSVNLKKGLQGTLRITTKDAFGNTTAEMIPFDELSEAGQARYQEIMDAIENASSGLSLSPIDVIKNELQKAGYKVGELTGRKQEFVYNDDGTVKRVKRQDSDKKRTAADFNNGKLDALILNKSAGTGISLHASSKFGDQRQRVMIVAQAQGDVNDEVQIRGRIDRTGQVLRGMYEYVVSQIPSEQRLLMMLKAKLRSLDANTTSSQKSKFNEMQVQDIINKYGDDIVIQYLAEHPDLAVKMVDPLKWKQKFGDGWESMAPETLASGIGIEKGEAGSVASKVLGRMALLKVAEQEKMLQEVGDLYQSELDRLNEMGENDLEITEMPLRAKTLKKDVWEEGVEPGGNNPFADNSYVEEVEMDVLRKPMKAEEVKKAQARLLGAATRSQQTGQPTWEDYKRGVLERLDKWEAEKKKEATETITARAEKKAQVEKEKYAKGAKKAQEKNGMTDAEIERNSEMQYEHFYEEEMKKLQTTLEAIGKQKQAFVEALDTFSTDGVYALPTDIYDLGQLTFEPSFGKVIDIKISDNFSTTASTISFATLDGRRKITIPISGMVKQNNGEKRNIFPIIMSQTAQTRSGFFGSNIANTLKVLEQNIDNWDKLTSTATRKKGYIITGNLLKALTSLQNQHQGGKLISYTTDTGEIRQGILMGDRFNPGSLTSKNPISSKKDELKYPRDKVESADKEVTVKVSNQWDWRESGYNTLELIVPKSKKKGEKYFNDETLLGLMDGQFEGSTKLKAEFKRENLEAVLKRLDELGVTVESQKEESTAEPSNSERRYDEDITSARQEGSSERIQPNRTEVNGHHQRIAEHIDKLLDRLGTKGKTTVYHSFDELPSDMKQHIRERERQGRKVRGWYENGHIYLYLPHIDSIYQAEKTIWHETVAHHGLRELVGAENYDKLLRRLWLEHRNGDMGKWVTERMQRNGWKLNEAIDEYLAREAEKEPFKEPTLWQRLRWMVAEVLHKMGFMSDPTLTDIKYLFWVSQNRLRENDPMSIIKQQAFLHRLDRAGRAAVIQRQTEPYVNMNAEREEDIYNPDAEGAYPDGSRAYSEETDEEVIERLEREPKIKVYRAMQLIDGKLYPPMAAKQGGKLVNPIELGKWEKADEHPEMVDSNGKFKLDKGNGKSLKAAYNPYIHTSSTMLNDQFSEAQSRPNLVVVEVEVPESELTSGYKAEKAKDAVGRLEWKAGVIQGQLTGTREVILSRWDKPVRIVPTEEVAKSIANQIKGKVDIMPSNVVTPAQREALEKEGVKFVETDNRGKLTEGEHQGESYSSVYGKKSGRRYDEDIEDPLEYSEKAVYHERLDRVATMFTEAYQDAMVSLKTAQNAIAKDKEIPDSQNAYQAENLSHGKIKNETDLFNSQLRDPLIATINKIMNATGMTWGDVDRYVYTKSGLERNREFFVRDWLKKERRKNISHYEQLNDAEKAIYDRKEKKIEELFEDGSIATEEEKNKALKRSLQEAHGEYIDSVEDGWQREKEEWDTPYFPGYLYRLDAYIRNYIDDGYSPEKHDYSGFRAMYGDEDGKYNEDDIIGELMNTEGAIEDASAVPTERLWDQIRACTRYGLERYRQAGMRSDEQIDDIEKMFHWYVPMRGFAEDRGEDMYQYFTSKGSAKSYVGGLLKHAKGRGSEASYPISTIFAMTYKAISDCNQNIVNQYLYRLCQAHKNDLIVLSDSWVVLNEETDEWEEAWPEIPEDADDEEVRQITLEFEERMKALAQQGAARKLNGKPRFDYKPADRRKKDEHVVEVRINGQQKRMTVVGNPRLAQALNGQLRFERGKNFLSKWNAAIKNFMSALFTSYSPTFALRNMFRDWTHFRTMLSVREGEGYAKRANKYYRQSLPRMVSLFKKYRAGKLDMNNEMERDFKDFMDNGGITGFVQMRKIEDIQKEQEKMLKQMKNNKAVRLNDSMWKAILGAVEAFNEAIENNARFATFRASRHYAGRTRARSAYDAKEITVNFNKKGAGGKTAGFKSRDSKVTLAAESFGLTSQILGEGRIFFNATVQAICTTFKNFQNADGSLNKGYIAKWVGRYAMPPFMLGLALPLINKALEGVFGGDDDDDDKYVNLPEWVRRRNLCFYIGHNNFITIPVGQELAAFLSLGDIAAGMTYADDLKPVDKSFADEMLDVLNTFSPVDVGTKITKGGITKDPIADITGRTFSVLAPWVAVGQNLSWMGRPIYKEDRYKGDEYKPEYQMVFSSTNPVMVGASKLIHELSGGDEVQRGKIEVNPAIVQYLWEQYAGGPGKVFSNTISIGKDAKDLFTEGESPDFNIRKVEGLKAFVQQGDDRTAYYRVNAKYRKYEEDGERLKRDLTRYAELAKDDPAAKMKLENLRKGKDFTRAQMLFGENGMAKELRKMYKAVQNAPDSKTEKELRLRYNKAMKQAVEMLDEVGE